MNDETIEFPADEEWLELEVSPHAYVVSTHGRYYSLRKKRILVANVSQPTNRLRVQVQARKPDGYTASTTRTVALDVLTHFGPADGKVAERKSDVAVFADGDVWNCHIDNLSWARLDSDAHRANQRRIDDFDRGRMLAQARTAGEAEQAAAAAAPPKRRTTESARPGGLVTPDAVASALASRRTDKDLTPDESREIRAWWVARGGNKRGRLPADAIMAFDHERGGRRVGVGA